MLVIATANVVSNGPFEVCVLVRLHDGENGSGGLGDITDLRSLVSCVVLAMMIQLTRKPVGIWGY